VSDRRTTATDVGGKPYLTRVFSHSDLEVIGKLCEVAARVRPQNKRPAGRRVVPVPLGRIVVVYASNNELCHQIVDES